MATNEDEQIVLGLDIPKTTRQINEDIKKLQGKLEKVKASGELDSRAAVREINAQIAALKAKLDAVELKASINERQAGKTGRRLGKIISDAAQEAIDRSGINTDKIDALKEMGASTDGEGLKNLSSSLDSVADSAEKAESQVSSAADSMKSKLNPLKEIGLGILKNIFPENDIKTIVNLFDSIKTGAFSNISFDKIKNIGKLRTSVRI